MLLVYTAADCAQKLCKRNVHLLSTRIATAYRYKTLNQS